MQDIKNKLLNRKVDILDNHCLIEHAVLLPLVVHQNKLSLLFEVRSQHLKGQPGEICFPGGHIEANDSSLQDTAVRETSEELGINKEAVEILGQLNTLITPHQLKIYSYVGIFNDNTAFHPDPSEVEDIFFIPLDFFFSYKPSFSRVNVILEPETNFPFHLIPHGRDYYWRKGQYPVYFYHYEKHLIWGITARILHHFIEVIR